MFGTHRHIVWNNGNCSPECPSSWAANSKFFNHHHAGGNFSHEGAANKVSSRVHAGSKEGI